MPILRVCARPCWMPWTEFRSRPLCYGKGRKWRWCPFAVVRKGRAHHRAISVVLGQYGRIPSRCLSLRDSPLFCVALIAGADGTCQWYWQRTSPGRRRARGCFQSKTGRPPGRKYSQIRTLTSQQSLSPNGTERHNGADDRYPQQAVCPSQSCSKRAGCRI